MAAKGKESEDRAEPEVDTKPEAAMDETTEE
jgi:hypothetical protein